MLATPPTVQAHIEWRDGLTVDVQRAARAGLIDSSGQCHH
jgi:hypothetical protein